MIFKSADLTLNVFVLEMSGVRDIVQLKLQKRLIQEKINAAEHKMDRLGGILMKKSVSSNAYSIAPEELAVTSTGLTVSEFRVPKRSVKAVPIINHHNPYELDPIPITNQKILLIRQRHCVNTTGKTEVRNKLKVKEEKLQEKLRNQKRLPSISVPPSMLPNRYIRGELPCTIEHGTSGKYLSWACPLENLDYEYYLPLFFDGLQCKDAIISFIARQGIEDMLYASKGHPERVKAVIHLLVRPMRNALSKFDCEVLLATLKALQQLITCNEGVGEALMPFGKQFLAPISYFLNKNKNIGDSIDYGQRKSDDIGEEVRCADLFFSACNAAFRFERCWSSWKSTEGRKHSS